MLICSVLVIDQSEKISSLREENAKLVAKITELEAELRERVSKLEEKQLQNEIIKTYYPYRQKCDHVSQASTQFVFYFYLIKL
jgi:hypothetical protein